MYAQDVDHFGDQYAGTLYASATCAIPKMHHRRLAAWLFYHRTLAPLVADKVELRGERTAPQYAAGGRPTRVWVVVSCAE